MRTRSFALSSMLSVLSRQLSAGSSQFFNRSRFTPHASRLLLFALCSLPVLALFTAASEGAQPEIKKVTISKKPGSPRGAVTGKTGETFLVEVVRDLQGLKKGLSQRERIPEGSGMLFVLDAAKEHAFWMKGMRFPLDIIFIGRNMQISEILENLQPCEECPVYFPKTQPTYALELNTGIARKHGLSVGDTMVIEK